ncbi:hypothetical protein [Burkholderia lata]|uniref:hypothetical protein n=1 Tax=Burkholderia lata (strain ATCC 17760 / DSM 23089 / LMG 22485 / NCIMB 9086 / R18194 / 383) TaxID=482957 RepID=UPI001453B4DC|nr:hypothetical protein [Burkholderia lata]VWB88370.1 hypothetical protein BLA15816_04248 [Burkholderia lata]
MTKVSGPISSQIDINTSTTITQQPALPAPEANRSLASGAALQALSTSGASTRRSATESSAAGMALRPRAPSSLLRSLSAPGRMTVRETVSGAALHAQAAGSSVLARTGLLMSSTALADMQQKADELERRTLAFVHKLKVSAASNRSGTAAGASGTASTAGHSYAVDHTETSGAARPAGRERSAEPDEANHVSAASEADEAAKETATHAALVEEAQVLHDLAMLISQLTKSLNQRTGEHLSALTSS